MGNARSFLRIWCAVLAGMAIVVAGINLLIDPYEVFGTPRIGGISLLKPAAKNHALLAKTYQERRAHPVTVLIGSSSTHIGIDAAAGAWPAIMLPVYNYGIPGGYATSTSVATLRDALAGGGVKNAVVFLDFQNFFGPEQPTSGMTEGDRRFHTLPDGTANPARMLQVANDMFLSAGTMGALIDSLETIVGQSNPDLLNLAGNGSSTEADFRNAARSDGIHDLFAQKDDFEAERADALVKIMAEWKGNLPNLGLVREMIVLSKAHDVTLTLVITPHHADALEIYWRNGLWPRLEQLRTELVAMVAEQGGAVSLWDFMDYSDFNTESIPAAGDRKTQTHWFWEPTHFKKQLGEIMIGRMFGNGHPAFGAKLTPDTVAPYNASIRTQRRARVCNNIGVPLLTASVRVFLDGCDDAAAGSKRRS
jgi:hypothetical protein